MFAEGPHDSMAGNAETRGLGMRGQRESAGGLPPGGGHVPGPGQALAAAGSTSVLRACRTAVSVARGLARRHSLRGPSPRRGTGSSPWKSTPSSRRPPGGSRPGPRPRGPPACSRESSEACLLPKAHRSLRNPPCAWLAALLVPQGQASARTLESASSRPSEPHPAASYSSRGVSSGRFSRTGSRPLRPTLSQQEKGHCRSVRRRWPGRGLGRPVRAWVSVR